MKALRRIHRYITLTSWRDAGLALALFNCSALSLEAGRPVSGILCCAFGITVWVRAPRENHD